LDNQGKTGAFHKESDNEKQQGEKRKKKTATKREPKATPYGPNPGKGNGQIRQTIKKRGEQLLGQCPKKKNKVLTSGATRVGTNKKKQERTAGVHRGGGGGVV